MCMSEFKTKIKQETHPLFPSGLWEGFYTYYMGPDAAQHWMSFHLDFADGLVSGGGSDDIAGFSWKGTYQKGNLTCNMTKYYPSHNVIYSGYVDENGIWGTWKIQLLTGGFHIWPKAKGKNEQEEGGEKVEISLDIDPTKFNKIGF